MPAVKPDDLKAVASELFQTAFDTSLPEEERKAAFEAHQKIKDAAFAAALGDFRKGSLQFIDLASSLARSTQALAAGGSARLKQVQADIARLQARLHDDEGMRTTWSSNAEFEETFADETELPAGAALSALPAAPAGLSRIDAPAPVDSRKFADLENEYLRFFAGQEWKSNSARATAMSLAERAAANRDRYAPVAAATGIPWWFIAGAHLLEASFNFGTHLHNGDSLADRTFRVPAGRPKTGAPPFTWEDSAIDALKGEGLAGLANWSLARALYRWEAYNGFGYRSRGVPTPYLWSLSSIYSKGKFVGDGVFDANAVSKQCGAAVFLRALIELGAPGVDPKAEVRDEGAGDAAESDAADAAPAAAGDAPNIDGTISTNQDFKTFFETELPNLRHFEWHEFMVKGGSHQSNGLNTDPPRELWPNVLPLARVLDEVREAIGHPMVLTSVYRSPAYNATLPGAAKTSQHMRFCAADFKVPGFGAPADWRQAVLKLRDQGVFSGGVGLYKTFVHVDTRGVNRDW